MSEPVSARVSVDASRVSRLSYFTSLHEIASSIGAMHSRPGSKDGDSCTFVVVVNRGGAVHARGDKLLRPTGKERIRGREGGKGADRYL